MKTARFPGYRRCLAMMRRRDPLIQEAGFQLLLPHAAEHVRALIGEFRRERDSGLRCWLLELVAEAAAPEAFPLFAEALHGDDDMLWPWAAYGLDRIGTKEARRDLLQARARSFPDAAQARRFRSILARVRRWR